MIQRIQNNFTRKLFFLKKKHKRGKWQQVFQWNGSHSEVCVYTRMERQRLVYTSVTKDFISNKLTTKLHYKMTKN